MSAKKVPTHFRAYQLGSPGSSFSYSIGSHFTLLEARLTEMSRSNLEAELGTVGKKTIDLLHITSWDLDHCDPTELDKILAWLTPATIEYPGYEPHSDSGKDARAAIKKYASRSTASRPSLRAVTPDYISSLESAKGAAYKNILYWPKEFSDKCNDNSVVKFFRTGAFNVLSLGDVESPNIAASMRRQKILQEELDVMILAHHGADNGFTTAKFLKHVQPTAAVCSSNYDNQFEHPKEEIRELLHTEAIPLYTTKTGDVLVRSLEPHDGKFRVTNLKAGSTEISSQKDFVAKKRRILAMNADTIRQRYGSR